MGLFDDIFNRDKTKTSNFDFRLTQDNMHLMQPDVVYGISKMESLLPPNMRMGATPDESKQKLNKIFGINSDYKPMLEDYNGLGHPGKYARDYAAYYSAGRTGESFDHMAKEYSKGGFIPDAIKKAFALGRNDAKNNSQSQQLPNGTINPFIKFQSDKKPIDIPPDMGYNSKNRNKSSDASHLMTYEPPKFLSSPAENTLSSAAAGAAAGAAAANPQQINSNKETTDSIPIGYIGPQQNKEEVKPKDENSFDKYFPPFPSFANNNLPQLGFSDFPGFLKCELKQNTTNAFANDYVGDNADEAKVLRENPTAENLDKFLGFNRTPGKEPNVMESYRRYEAYKQLDEYKQRKYNEITDYGIQTINEDKFRKYITQNGKWLTDKEKEALYKWHKSMNPDIDFWDYAAAFNPLSLLTGCSRQEKDPNPPPELEPTTIAPTLPQNEKAVKYREAAQSFDVANNPKYQYDEETDTYWCTTYVKDVMRVMGINFPLDSGNGLYKVFAKGYRGSEGWIEVENAKEAWEYACQGYPAIALHENITTDDSRGHAQVIIPSATFETGGAQAGGINKFGMPIESREPTKYYIYSP